MIITEKLNDDDKKILKDLLDRKNKNMAFCESGIKAMYILVPITVLLIIINFQLHSQCLLYTSRISAILELLYIMMYLIVVKQYQKKDITNKFIDRMDKIKEITIEEVKLDDKKICNTSELKRVIKFSNFVLLVTNKRKILIFKINDDDMKELQSIILSLNIPFKEEKEYFYIYKYLF
ncbi:hypothetical protein [Lachnospira multipara]|uniref:YcxB-like protein n=1 Tax=Lachnospira multipara TaxID=28051 RepID=A0A1H5WS45_9FIRM|nr:hypothetical protein [Lachnospira multipara]SEG02409.1 hypothetical protein SAMN05216537_11817 [Lachnospira multipara]